MKKGISAAAALLLCLTGCADRNSSVPRPTDTTAAMTETTALKTGHTQSTEPEAPDYSLPALTAPLTEISVTGLAGTAEAIVCRGVTAAVQCSAGGKQQYHIVDLKEQKTVRSGELTGANEYLAGLTEAGEAVTLSSDTGGSGGILRYYGEAEMPRSCEAAWIGSAVYDQTNDCVFGFDPQQNAVMCMDGRGTESVFLQLGSDRALLGIYPDRRVMMITEPSADLLQPVNAAAYSIDSGIRLGAFPYYDSTSYAFFSGGMLQVTASGGDALEVRTSRFMDRKVLSCWKTEDKNNDHRLDLRTDFASAYALGTEQSGGLLMADLKAGTRAVQAFPDGAKASAARFCCSPETSRWLIAASFAGSGGTVTRLFAAEPRLAGQTETYPTAEPLTREPERHSPAGYLEGARSLADSIARRYGIRILIGDEVKDVPAAAERTVSAEDAAGALTEEGVSAETVILLKKLDARLRVYPNGFFSKFRDEYGEGGLAVLLVHDVLPDSAKSGVFSVPAGKWFTVALRSADDIHRGIWLAAEARISRSDPQAFSESDDSPEERASLIGWLFEGYSAYQQLGEERKLNWELLPQMPERREKVDFMAERVKKAFGAVYWEQIMQAGYDNTVFENEDFSPYP
ncbi:MAG: hypothetical protein J6Z45_03635 [Oscillospiraceae bacterium]|nr:hypothetical protein [Oscillospiraceae bacterium]